MSLRNRILTSWMFGICQFTALLITLMAATETPAYVLQTDRNSQGRFVNIKWPESTARNGIPYRVSTRFPFSQSDLLRIVTDSFEVWENTPESFVSVRRESTGSFRSSSSDRRHVITYDTTGNEIGAPRGSGVIAVTIISSDENGSITDCDIVFNGRDFRFSVDPSGPSGNLVDLQDVMTHEIGHFLGLDHTPLQGTPSLRPTMNPFNDASNPGLARTLELDDKAGITTLYPSPEAASTGTISGRVLHPDGSGTFGVNVVAYQAGSTRFAVCSLSGSVGASQGSGGDGEYEISGLPPGDYQLAIEPVTNGISFRNFGGIYNQPFDTQFQKEFYSNVSVQSAASTLSVGSGRVLTDIDFALGTAVAGAPFLADFDLPVNTPDTRGPYLVQTRIRDDGGVADAQLVYDVDGGASHTLTMQSQEDDLYAAQIPGQPAGSVVSYRLSAVDFDGNPASLPTTELPPLSFEVLALSGDPLLYVALRRSGEVSVVDTGTGSEVARIPAGEDPLSVGLTPDGVYLFVTNSGSFRDQNDNRVTVIETATHRVAKNITVGPSPLDLVVSPDGRRVFVSNSGERSVSVIDVGQLVETRRLNAPVVGTGPFGIALSAQGDIVYVTDSDAAEVLAIDTQSDELLHRISVISSPRSLALSPDGNSLYVSGFDGGITVVDTRTHAAVQTIDTSPAGGIFRLAPTPDGRLLFATDWLGANLLVIDLATAQLTDIVAVPAGGRNTRDLSLSSSGEVVYVANQDSNDLIFFDAGTLNVIHTLTLADGPRGIAFRQSPPQTGIPQTSIARSDFDESGRVDFNDFLIFAGVFGSHLGDLLYNERLDLDGNGSIGFEDFLIFASDFGKVVA